MRMSSFLAVLLLMVGRISALDVHSNEELSIYTLSAVDAAGNQMSLSSYRGQVLLVVNVASECGYTDGHYRELVRLQNTHAPLGLFNVLAFPCNQFGQQEPLEIGDIVQFARNVYGASFQIFNKVDVIGENAAPLWKFLRDESGYTPTWNFWKYLIDHRGNVIGAWSPHSDFGELEQKLRAALTAAQADSEFNGRRAEQFSRGRDFDGDL